MEDWKDNGLPMKNREPWKPRIHRVEFASAIRGIYRWGMADSLDGGEASGRIVDGDVVATFALRIGLER